MIYLKVLLFEVTREWGQGKEPHDSRWPLTLGTSASYTDIKEPLQLIFIFLHTHICIDQVSKFLSLFSLHNGHSQPITAFTKTNDNLNFTTPTVAVLVCGHVGGGPCLAGGRRREGTNHGGHDGRLGYSI